MPIVLISPSTLPALVGCVVVMLGALILLFMLFKREILPIAIAVGMGGAIGCCIYTTFRLYVKISEKEGNAGNDDNDRTPETTQVGSEWSVVYFSRQSNASV